jgi:hypothetical protein
VDGSKGSKHLASCSTVRYVNGMNDDGIRQQLELLRIEHRDMDAAIMALQEKPILDQLQIARFKRRKLALKDRIRQMEDQLIPDIIA